MLDNNVQTTSHSIQGTIIEADLREYLRKVYNFMAGGLVVTALTSYIIMNTPLLHMFFSISGNQVSLSILGWLILLAPLAMVFYFSSVIRNGSSSKAQTVFWIFSALMGASLTPTVLLYTGASIARIFLITAATFGAMSIYGYTSKKDLSSIGSFCIMALWGIIIASLVNLFFSNSMTNTIISIISVFIFIGLTAYDTQKIKAMYIQSSDTETMNKIALSGALELYLDFINLFLALLRLFGDRK